MKIIHVVIRGIVQGVCFRHYTCRTAQALGIDGWVRNRPDGTVEVLAGGPEEAMREFEQWLGHGPRSARVDDVAHLTVDAPPPLKGFSVR